MSSNRNIIPANCTYSINFSLSLRRVTISYSRNATPSADGTLGFNLTQLTDIYPVYSVEYSFLESFPKGWDLGMTTLSNYAGSMKHVFSKRGEKRGEIPERVPVPALRKQGPQSAESAETLHAALAEHMLHRSGIIGQGYSFWYLTAFLSVALAVMNILPIPALDGGHVLFLLYEMVTRRKLSEKFTVSRGSGG